MQGVFTMNCKQCGKLNPGSYIQEPDGTIICASCEPGEFPFDFPFDHDRECECPQCVALADAVGPRYE